MHSIRFVLDKCPEYLILHLKVKHFALVKYLLGIVNAETVKLFFCFILKDLSKAMYVVLIVYHCIIAHATC